MPVSVCNASYFACELLGLFYFLGLIFLGDAQSSAGAVPNDVADISSLFIFTDIMVLK